MIDLFAAATPSSGVPTFVVVVSGLVGAIFGTGGIAMWLTARRQNRKLDAETGKLKVETDVLPIEIAKGAVVVQSDVIKDLRDQIGSQEKQLKEQGRLIEHERKKHDAEAERADEAYRRLDEKCSRQADSLDELQRRHLDLLERFDELIRRDELTGHRKQAAKPKRATPKQ